MRKFELIAPCHFGLEAVLKKEIIDLGYDVLQVEDGRITFFGDEEAVSRANVFLRSAERILIKVGSFHAETFEELFQGTKGLAWEEYIPRDGKFWVAKAASVKSKLFSPSDIQSIMKKAMVERLKESYHAGWFEENGASFPVRVFLMKDEVTVGLDTTGESLHKRGYRKLTAKAPIAENLAASLIMLTPWRGDRILVDPFCGSGTFPIEAALMAANMAPGMNRSFTAENWPEVVARRNWYDAVDEAGDMVDLDVVTDIQGYDIDDKMVSIARENARLAGVEKLIHFQRRPLSQLSHPRKYGFLITNPPYGERLEEKAALPALYKEIGERFAGLDSWSMYLITAYENAERDIGRKADKNRKIYNGMMKTYFYQYLGPRPPKRQKQED
ncbi:MAG: THUMP domain-containing class I SAM-dependent RNA methyltransferase [Eisenbergiella sp.]|jgi:putative N6-adenine-specific DNA methylase|uniref:THUMP domain-containing class I SAM-dependent RNA methyltransferase n=1 Tax=unclassified Eisenbergiella TaxID=2652273 RepID=UPI000E4FF28C|nr:class I SAM-dependent RNA methyltransferase [Eisenbergiella sp. OF01-20]MBS5538582.1 class I SAM-dependent RNA methyltransferase [Lachnospiraceae bacterium]RHP86375.1 class I SAM-dependent RNA methyltransferase [Eisenbergiella sp. OF01-20]